MSQTTQVESNAVDGRATRWDDHRQARRERLLETAMAMIDRDGAGVSVPAIAAEAGIPRSVVYKLFRDREDLDDQIRGRIVEAMNEALAPTLVLRGSVREMVRRAVDTYVKWVGAHGNLHRFMGTGSATRPSQGSRVVTGGKSAFAQDVQALADSLLPMVVTGKLPRGASADLAYALVGLVDATVNRWLLAGPGNRTSARNLSRFLTDAACGVICATVALVGGELDVDQRFGG
ncbi:TetR/AcrR family transcriptional regulator [Nocardioides montaniterrae]